VRAALYRASQALLLLAVVITLGVGLVLGTERGRSRLLVWSITRVNASIPGRLQVAELARIGPLGIELVGLTLDDPTGQRVQVHGLSVRAPEVGSLGQIEVRELTLSAGVELDQAPSVELRSLSCRLYRGESHVGSVASLQGRLAPPGQSSDLTLTAQLADVQLQLTARGVLPPAPGYEISPIQAHMAILGLRAEQLAEWLGDASLAHAWDGDLGLELSASGSPHDLSIQARLNSRGGSVELRSRFKQLRELELELGVGELLSSQLRAGLPPQPLSFRLEAFADVADPRRIPLRLRLHAARLGDFALPDLGASASWQAGQLTGLHAELRRGESSAQVSGDLDLAGAVALDTAVDIRGPELAEIAGALGRSERPVGRIGATLQLTRKLGGELRLLGKVLLQQLEIAGTRLARADIRLDLAGAAPDLAGTVHAELRGLETGQARLQRASLHVTGGPRQYRIQADAALVRLHAP
jgi:hypothetical protein